MSKSRKKKKDSFKIIYMILGIEMLVTVAVIGYFVSIPPGEYVRKNETQRN